MKGQFAKLRRLPVSGGAPALPYHGRMRRIEMGPDYVVEVFDEHERESLALEWAIPNEPTLLGWDFHPVPAAALGPVPAVLMPAD